MRGLADEDRAPYGSDLIERELERYYEMINNALEHLGGLFDLAERRAWIETAFGVIYELKGSINNFPNDVMDFLEQDAWAREHVDANLLMTELDTLNSAARFALVDAVERHWLSLRQNGVADLNVLFEPAAQKPFSPPPS